MCTTLTMLTLVTAGAGALATGASPAAPASDEPRLELGDTSPTGPAPPVVLVPQPPPRSSPAPSPSETPSPPPPPSPPAPLPLAPTGSQRAGGDRGAGEAPRRTLRRGPLGRWAVIRCGPPVHTLRLWTPRRHRRHRRRRRRRPRPWARPYHQKITPYVGVEVGHLALFPAKGSTWRLLQPTAWISGFFGWNYNPFVGVELSVGGSPLRVEDGGLGDLERVGVAAVSVDARVRLIEPAPHSPIVPYLQAGVGGYWFGGQRDPANGCGEQGCLLSGGVGVHAGAGLDIYLTRGAIFGLRVLYRHLVLSPMRCPAGSACAAAAAASGAASDASRGPLSVQLPSLSATAHFTVFWSHL